LLSWRNKYVGVYEGDGYLYLWKVLHPVHSVATDGETCSLGYVGGMSAFKRVFRSLVLFLYKLFRGNLYPRDTARGDLLLSAKERQLGWACGTDLGV